jgi:hypothetical protein
VTREEPVFNRTGLRLFSISQLMAYPERLIRGSCDVGEAPILNSLTTQPQNPNPNPHPNPNPNPPAESCHLRDPTFGLNPSVIY